MPQARKVDAISGLDEARRSPHRHRPRVECDPTTGATDESQAGMGLRDQARYAGPRPQRRKTVPTDLRPTGLREALRRPQPSQVLGVNCRTAGHALAGDDQDVWAWGFQAHLGDVLRPER